VTNRIQHFTADEVARSGWTSIPPDLRIIIPAHNVEATIRDTIMYLADAGLQPHQIIVVANNCSDGTFDTADSTASATTLEQDAIIMSDDAIVSACRVFEVGNERLGGKGTAMWAGTIAIAQQPIPTTAPVIFLDGDIQNIRNVDPLKALLYAWGRSPFGLTKLASLGRGNEGVHAFLAMMESRYRYIGTFQWPLCGQVILSWGDLQSMRFASGYAIEMAMAMQMLERGIPSDVFAEVAISMHLMDSENSDRKHVLMYAGLMRFMKRVIEAVREGEGLEGLGGQAVARLNQQKIFRCWAPSEHGGARNSEEVVPLDAILPAMTDIF